MSKYNTKQLAKMVVKSMKKALKKDPIADVLDADFVAEADPKKVPLDKPGVMYKNKSDKLKNFLDKRKNKNKNKGKV